MRKLIIVIALLSMFLIVPGSSFTSQPTGEKLSVEAQQEEIFEGSRAVMRLTFIRNGEDGTFRIILESPTKAFYFSGARLDSIKRK